MAPYKEVESGQAAHVGPIISGRPVKVGDKVTFVDGNGDEHPASIADLRNPPNLAFLDYSGQQFGLNGKPAAYPRRDETIRPGQAHWYVAGDDVSAQTPSAEGLNVDGSPDEFAGKTPGRGQAMSEEKERTEHGGPHGSTLHSASTERAIASPEDAARKAAGERLESARPAPAANQPKPADKLNP